MRPDRLAGRIDTRPPLILAHQTIPLCASTSTYQATPRPPQPSPSMPLSFYPSRQQPHSIAMVVDGSRIPAPSPTRSRLARPSQPSRIPARSATSTPRRASGAHNNDSRHPKTPTSIPAPRRVSRDPRTPPMRRTPVKPTDRTDPPLVRTPRRTNTPVRTPGQENKLPRSAIPAPRRVSKEPPLRVGVPRYGSRLSANSQEPPRTRARTMKNEPNVAVRNGFNQASSKIQPSPRRTSNHRPRPGLSPSPYAARRTSAGGNVRAMTSVTPRKLNMGQDEEDRRLSNAATVRRLSAAKDRMTDRVEPRRESLGTPRRGMTALESFRAARRASLEVAEKKKQEIEMENNDVVMTDVPGPSNVAEPISPFAATTAPVLPTTPTALPEQTLPDRLDPLTPGMGIASNPVTPTGKPRRRSTRFSEADICLDGVEQLRKSLGRRRSVGYGERIPEDMETPTLRRSSIGERLKLQAELEKQEQAEKLAALEREKQQRLPLGSLETNKENIQSVEEKDDKRRSKIPTLEGDEFEWGNEEVEDLRP